MKTFLALFLTCLSVVAQTTYSDDLLLTRSSALLQGLQGYWRLEEASGTRYDRSKNGNHLTPNNAPGQTGGVSSATGNAATFTFASSQYLYLSDTNKLQFEVTNSWTIAAWIKLTSSGQNQVIVSKENAGAGGYSMSIVGGKLYSEVVSSSGVAFFAQQQITGNLTNDAWHLVIVTYNGNASYTGINLYVDNVGQSSTPTSGSTVTTMLNAAQFSIGTLYNFASRYANGIIDEVGVWNRLLTLPERTLLYNNGNGTTHPQFFKTSYLNQSPNESYLFRLAFLDGN